MSVFEVGRTISESTGGHASAGGNSGAGNRFYFSDDAHAELGLQRGNSYDVRIRLKGNTSGHIKLTMIGHRGYAPNAGGNRPFCYIVEALPQQMGTRTALSSTVQGVDTKSFEDGIEAQHLMGLNAGDFYPTVSCFQYTDYTEIVLRVMNKSAILESRQNRSNVVDITATDHSAALTKHYAGQSDNTVAGQSGEMGGDAIFFTAYIEGYSYNSTLSEDIYTSYNRMFGGRGVVAGGSPDLVTIEYLALPVKGDSVDFGDLTVGRHLPAGLSNGSRGILAGGDSPGAQNEIDYIAFGTIANSKDFGDLSDGRATTAASDGSRGVFGGGTPPAVNTIDYITISIPGGTALDFGDITSARYALSADSNGSRAVFGGGYVGGYVNTIDHVSIGAFSNASDFGDLTQARNGVSATGDGSRAVFGNGASPSLVNTLDYFNISTVGNALDFGDLTVVRRLVGAASDGSRGVWMGSYGGSPSDTIDFITIATVGNAADFGDLVTDHGFTGGTSGD